MKRKLITIDLDGTTLNSESKISPKTKHTLQKASQAGHIVSIVTGRPYRISKHIYDNLGIKTPLINFNGALGHLPHQTWDQEYSKTFSKKIALDLVSSKDELGIKLITAEGKNYALADKASKIIKDFFPSSLKSNEILNKINLQQDPSAMTMLVDENKKSEIITSLENTFGDVINVSVWGGEHPILELSPKGVSKADGLEFLSKIYDIDREDIIAFGDEQNDETMIEYAGLGVVMQNGTDKLKSIADDITEFDNNHDGLAKHLEKILKLD